MMIPTFHRIPKMFAPRAAVQASAHDGPCPAEDTGYRPFRETGRITCSPWEGLYLDYDVEIANMPGNKPASADENLEGFLAALMFGE